jgi:hypothetical protein
MMTSALRGRWLAVALVLVARPGTPSYLYAEPRQLPRTVLTIHAGAEDFPANPVLVAAIREALKSSESEPIAYFAEYLEADSFQPDEASMALAEYIRRKYRGRRVDLVIASTSVALRFVLDNRDELFADAPIVFGGLTVPNETVRRSGSGLAVVRVGSAYAQTLKLALALHPQTERVFVVATSAFRDDVSTVRWELQEFSRVVDLRDWWLRPLRCRFT